MREKYPKKQMNITPETTVAELLKAYPRLESVLVQFSSAFSALKNPLLRRTVAKVTTLRQAAKVGNTDLTEMINFLRKEAGQTPIKCNVTDEKENFYSNIEEIAAKVTRTFDARPLIEQGIHPKDEVIALAETLQSGDCLELITPFEPTPLVDILREKGYNVSVSEPENQIVKTFIIK